MIRTASYFNPKDHVGKLISISGSEPPGFIRDGKIKILAPPKSLVMDLKNGVIDWTAYEIAYTEQLRNLMKPASTEATLEMMEVLNQGDCTLLCWEHTPAHCHRRLVAEWLQKEFGISVEVR